METNNPASALRNILTAVMDSGEQTVTKGWEFVLKAPHGSPKFAQLHSEVVGIYMRVYERLLALPGDTDGKGQFMQYLPAWYEAITYRSTWNNTQHPPSSIGDRQVISQLTGLAYAFDMHSLTTKTPSGLAIKQLKDSLGEWHSILDDAEFDEKLRNELRAHVNRLDILLSNNLIFGTEPVIEASKNLMGAAFTAMGRSSGSFKKRVGAALLTLVAVVGGGEQVVSSVNGMLEGVIEMRSNIRELTDDSPAIEQRTTPELGSDVMDGAVVETGALVAAKALISPGKRVPAGQVWAGQPGKYLCDVKEAQQAMMDRIAPGYVELAGEFRAAGLDIRDLDATLSQMDTPTADVGD